MADFPADDGAFPANSGLLADSLPLPFAFILEGVDRSHRNRRIEPNDGYIQMDVATLDSATIDSSRTIYSITTSTQPAEPGGELRNALLNAQILITGGPAYPLTGQRWPWKAEFFYIAR